MPLQRKHYNAIAAALRSAEVDLPMVQRIADMFWLYGPDTFDYNKFCTKAMTGQTMEARYAKAKTKLFHIWRWRYSNALIAPQRV